MVKEAKKLLITLLFPILFIFSFSVNSSGDFRPYFKVIGIVALICLFVLKDIRKQIVLNTNIHIIVAIISSLFITMMAYIFPRVNNGLNSILPNHFIAHIAALFIAYNLCIWNEKCFETAMKIVCCIIFFTAIFGILLYAANLAQPGKLILGYTNYSERLSSVYVNPIPAGSVFLAGFWLTTLFKSKGFAILQRVVFFIVIVLTENRSTWIGLLISVALLLLMNRSFYTKQFLDYKKTKRIALISLITISAVVVLVYVYFKLRSRFTGIMVGEAYNVRMSYWRYIWALFLQEDLFWELFGHGYGSSSSMMLNSPVYYEPYAIIDNGLLTVLYENGAICLFALFIVFYRAWLVVKDKNRIGSIKWSCGMVVLALIIPSCFYEIQGWNSPILLALFCMAPFIARTQENK